MMFARHGLAKAASSQGSGRCLLTANRFFLFFPSANAANKEPNVMAATINDLLNK